MRIQIPSKPELIPVRTLRSQYWSTRIIVRFVLLTAAISLFLFDFTLRAKAAQPGAAQPKKELGAALGPGLDPVPGRVFLVSVEVAFDPLPPGPGKQLILSKYDPSRDNPPGWALALTQFRTSTRPEVYYRGASGGGWFTFDEIEIKPKERYTFTLVARADRGLLLYISQAGQPGRFLGAADIGDAGEVRTVAPLIPGTAKGGKFMLRGELFHVVIVSPETIDLKRDALAKFTAQGSRAILSAVNPDDVRLTLGGS